MHTAPPPPGQLVQMGIENSRDGFLSGPRVEEARSLARSRLDFPPPQQIECRIGIPIIPDALAGLEGAKEGKDD